MTRWVRNTSEESLPTQVGYPTFKYLVLSALQTPHLPLLPLRTTSGLLLRQILTYSFWTSLICKFTCNSKVII